LAEVVEALRLHAKATQVLVRPEFHRRAQEIREEVPDLLLLDAVGAVVVEALTKETGHRVQGKVARILTKWLDALTRATFPLRSQEKLSRGVMRASSTPEASSSSSLPPMAVNLIVILVPAEALRRIRRAVLVETTGAIPLLVKMSSRLWRMPNPSSKPTVPRP